MDVGDAAFVATPSIIAEARKRLEKEGREYATDALERAEEADVPCETDVRSGIPEEGIVEYARDNGVDLVVMGNRGRSNPDEPASGPIADRVIGSTDALVLTA